jgi:hypothetical protein
MTLMPVSNISSCVDCASSVGAGRWIGHVLLANHGAIREVHGLAQHVQDAPERGRAHGHRDRRAGVDGGHAALHAVGRLHRDGAHAAFAKVLLHFDHDVDGRGGAGVRHDAHGVVDVRKVAVGELDVHGGADDLDHAAVVLSLLAHDAPYNACAPETTSMISRVMAAWRTLFM